MAAIIKMFKFIWDTSVSTAAFFIRGKIFNKTEGAAFLEEKDYSDFLSSRNDGLLLDGVKLRLTRQESFQNILLAARVGAGKTTKFIVPNVLDKANKNCSLVVHDPKGEVFELTSGYMKAKGFNVIVFNPSDAKHSHLFNPFTEAKNEIELEQIAETLIWSGNPSPKEPYWNNGATRILSVLIKCLKYSDHAYFNLPNLYYLLQNFGELGEGLDDWIIKNGRNPEYPADDYLIQEWQGVLTGNKEAIQSFVGVCMTALKALTNRELQLFFSESSYKLSDLRKQRTVIYFITPPEHQKYYSFATSLFFRSIFNACMRKEHLSGKTLPVYILYDEFGNSYVSDFQSVANTIRGYGVSLSIILQSIAQLSDKYGKETAEAIGGAFNTNLCLDSSDPVTANYFSNLSGKVRERQARASTSNQGMLDPNTEYREYNLLNSNEVRTMRSDEVLIISKNRNPVKVQITPYFKNRRMRKMTVFPILSIKTNISKRVPLVDLRK
jgi:type IV secretory pathway TraG/TraD family ATPase VirD4